MNLPAAKDVMDLVDTFGIALPPEWTRFPLENGDFEAFVQLQRHRLANEAQLSRTAQRQFELLMRQLRNDCGRANVKMVAVMLATIDDPDPDPDPDPEPDPEPDQPNAGLLSATCTISAMSRASLGSDLPLTENTIAAAMSRGPVAGDDGVEIVDLDPPAIVTLPVGRAVKLVRLHTFPPDAKTRQRLAVFAQHVLVPYDNGERAAVLSFSSPTPAYAKPLSALFDAMSKTFRLFAGDMPTDPLAPTAAGHGL
jgi:hypothetical protein